MHLHFCFFLLIELLKKLKLPSERWQKVIVIGYLTVQKLATMQLVISLSILKS